MNSTVEILVYGMHDCTQDGVTIIMILLTCSFNRLSEGMPGSGFASPQTSSNECFISQLGLYLGQNHDVPPSNNSGKAIDCA